MVMGMWALIEGRAVIDLTDLDPDGRYHESFVWVPCDERVRPGWGYLDGVFVEPSPGPYYELKDGVWVIDVGLESQGLAASARVRRAELEAVARDAITPLAYAVDLGMATAGEAALYDLWRRYVVELSRVEQQEGFPRSVGWPDPPVSAST